MLGYRNGENAEQRRQIDIQGGQGPRETTLCALFTILHPIQRKNIKRERL